MTSLDNITIRSYVDVLEHGDKVRWPGRKGQPAHHGHFVRCSVPPAKTIIVGTSGREFYVPLDKLIRACAVCGCTDDEGCLGGCFWSGRKTCSSCEKYFLPPTKRNKK
jgi:hypothetical protein